MNDYYVPAATLEEDFVNLVKLELNDIKKSFFRIGFRLNEANHCKYYKKLGFNTIEECAEALFGFKKTTTYDLINVYVSFADKETPMIIDPKYKNFSQSQLVLFASINYGLDGFVSRARPEDTIEKLKKAKKYWKEFMLRGVFCNGSYVSYSKTKTIDELIDLYESCRSLEPLIKAVSQENGSESLPKIEDNFSGHPEKNDVHNSGYPEKESTDKIVLDIPENKISEVAEEVTDDVSVEDEHEEETKCYTVNLEELRKNIFDYAGKRLDLLDYKTLFDPENKGLGVRVPSDDIVRFVLRQSFDYLTDHRVDIEKLLRKYFSEQIGQFDYQIMLCGRKQNLTVFCGNVSKYVIDFLLELFLLTPEKKEK